MPESGPVLSYATPRPLRRVHLFEVVVFIAWIGWAGFYLAVGAFVAVVTLPGIFRVEKLLMNVLVLMCAAITITTGVELIRAAWRNFKRASIRGRRLS